MSSTPVQLRGQISQGMRAREISLWATSDCDRVRALGTAGTTGRGAAAFFAEQDAYDFETEASRFATEAGFTHESSLLLNDAEHLRRLYRETLGVEIGVDRLEYFFDKDPLAVLRGESITDEDEEEAQHRTDEILHRCMSGADTEPVLMAQARVFFQSGGARFMVKPDVLLWDGTQLRAGEMKSYIDRGGYTSPGSVAAAIRQTAVSVVALRQFAAEHGYDPMLVAETADLFFRRRVSGGASMRVMTVAAEVFNLEAAVENAEDDRDRFLALAGGTLDSQDALRRIPARFEAGCRETCGLAGLCEAEQQEDLSVRFGSAVAELAAVGVSPHRAAELAAGSEPTTSLERRAAFALSAAWGPETPTKQLLSR